MVEMIKMDSGVEEELRNETLKWLERLKGRSFSAVNERGEDFEANIKAYIKDSEYFLSRGDLVRAFECVVWAWAWYEIGCMLKLLRCEDERESG